MEEDKTKKGPDQKYCENCGAIIDRKAVVCPHCGVQVDSLVGFKPRKEGSSEKSRLVALILAWFLGVLGVHRFYVGRVGSGILWLLTGGLAGVGVIVDLIMIATGKFKDKEGKPLLEWTID